MIDWLYSKNNPMVQMLESHCDLSEFEDYFYQIARADNLELANQIKAIDLSQYAAELKKAFTEAVNLAVEKDLTAIYFEFDSTWWDGGFYLCKYYVPKEMVDEENHTDFWVAEWTEDLYNAPKFEPFGLINEARVKGRYVTTDDVRAYLFARTFAVIAAIYREFDIKNMAVCCAFHDGPVIRLQEYIPPADRIFDQSKVVDPEPPEVVPLSKLEIYVLSYYSHLFDPPCLSPPRCVVLPVDPVNDPRIRVPELLEKYKGQIFINYCPFCGEVRLTPRAKQCLSCHKREEE